MKRTTTFIASLIAGIVFAFLIFALNSYFGQELQSLSFWFFIPAGGIIVGLACATIYTFLLQKLNCKFARVDYLNATLIAVFTYFLIHYITYRYVFLQDESGQKSSGITNKVIPLTEIISFRDYINISLSSSERSGTKINYSYNLGRTGTTTLFIIQLFGLLLGAAIRIFTKRSDELFCDSCNNYYTNKPLGKYETYGTDSVIIQLQEAKNSNKIPEVIETLPIWDSDDFDYTILEIVYCPKCHDAYLKTRTFLKSTNGEFKEQYALAQKIKIDKECAEELLLQ